MISWRGAHWAIGYIAFWNHTLKIYLVCRHVCDEAIQVLGNQVELLKPDSRDIEHESIGNRTSIFHRNAKVLSTIYLRREISDHFIWDCPLIMKYPMRIPPFLKANWILHWNLLLFQKDVIILASKWFMLQISSWSVILFQWCASLWLWVCHLGWWRAKNVECLIDNRKVQRTRSEIKSAKRVGFMQISIDERVTTGRCRWDEPDMGHLSQRHPLTESE
jgi:hypothetical protein